jgi:hypothetical protein
LHGKNTNKKKSVTTSYPKNKHNKTKSTMSIACVTLYDILVKTNKTHAWNEAVMLELEVPCTMHFKTARADTSTDAMNERAKLNEVNEIKQRSFEINVLCVSKQVTDEVCNALVPIVPTHRQNNMDETTQQHDDANKSCWTSVMQDFFNARLHPCVQQHCASGECDTPIPGRKWNINVLACETYHKMLPSYPVHFVVQRAAAATHADCMREESRHTISSADAAAASLSPNHNHISRLHNAVTRLQIVENWHGFTDLTKCMEQRIFTKALDGLCGSSRDFSVRRDRTCKINNKPKPVITTRSQGDCNREIIEINDKDL